MASIDSISESAPIDIEVSGAQGPQGPQGPRGRDAATTVVTGNFTAVNDYQYNVTASAVATDPTGVEGKGYTVFVINGTATVGGVAYPTEGTVIRRYFKSGTWYSKVYKDSTAYATAAQGTDERVPTAAGLTSKFGTEKGCIADNDRVAIFDSAAANAPKHTLWSVVKSTLKTYFDTVYAAVVHTHVSAQITDASTEPVYNESTELYDEVAALYSEDGELNAAGFITEGGSFYSFNGGDFAAFSLSGSPLSFKIGTKQFRFNQPVGNGGQYTVPDGSGTLALTSSASGAIVSADISDATTTGQANKVIKLDGSGGLACVAITASGAITTTGAASHISTSNANAAVISSNFLPVESGGASLKDGSYNACLTWGQSGRNLTIPSGVAVTIDATNFTLGTGTAGALKTALAIASADITDATSTPTANKVIKYGTNAQATAAWYQFPTVVSASTFNVTPLLFCPDYSGTTPSSEWEPIYGLPLIPEADVSTTLVITQNTDGSADKLTGGTISGTTTLNSTAYAFGTGAQTALKSNLDLFTLLTLQESDAGVYTENAGTATASQDGDSLSLSAATANQRPNVYRFRNWNRNPGVSGTANAVIPVRLACAGNIYHLGSGANGASLRCGFGMVNGASAVAANANATTGRGFGWRIAWNSSTSKLEFNLWAHDGTTYVEGTGIDTGIGAGNLDGFFNIIVGLASDGTVSANTWFGSSPSTSAVPSSTPTVTLAGGPTSGTFANLGTPSWIAAAHSTNAPASGNSIIARIVNRKLALG